MAGRLLGGKERIAASADLADTAQAELPRKVENRRLVMIQAHCECQSGASSRKKTSTDRFGLA